MDDGTPERAEPVSHRTLPSAAYRVRHLLALLSTLCLLVVG
jgi:hypothetical protein